MAENASTEGFGPAALLDEDTRLLAETVRGFLDAKIAPLVNEYEQRHDFPFELLPELMNLGYVRGPIAEAHGGYGMSHLRSAVLMEEAGRCWGSLRTSMNILTMVAELLSAHGTVDQRHRFLDPVLAGTRRGWFALTESEAGSDAGSLRTRAVRNEAGAYVLTGRKLYITNASHGDFGIVLATVDRALGSEGITAFIVERDFAGVQVNEIAHMPVRATSSCEVVLDGVVVPPENVLGEIGRGLSVAMSAVNGGRLNMAAGAVGLAQASLEAARKHVTTREQFGKPLAGFQLVQDLFVQIATQTHAGRLVYQQAARALDAGLPGRVECSMAKYFCGEMAQTAATHALQLHGGAGLMEESVVERLFRDAREMTIPEGTTQVQILQIGKALLGVSALR